MTTPAPRSILLLEDMAMVRGGMKALIQLAEPRAQVLEAAGHDEAVALLDARDVDFAFLDVDLRDARHTGLDVLRHLRSRGRPTLAIMLSAISDRATVMACIDAGACGYILKDMEESAFEPFRAEDVFRNAIETVLRGCLYLPASVLGRGGFVPAAPLARPVVGASELGLTPRQCEVLFYICQGLQNKAIADRMGIAEGTVRKDYVTAIYQCFGVRRRTELIVEISRRGIVVAAPGAREQALQ
ncbi:response regulator transcription factor [Aquincola sp. S2]|uniref:Response regulator transcription factor n=1 Tax=Pseudaquabacterium terrae TaxID=2732868 RepID=A0ABX2EIJ8_9BURK|nr:response regulator transcription factor [Aquabacterium terrae]NRF68396.1 response regulator transcription factor [Aquabacterium terrae]